MSLYLGLDVGTTKIAAVILDSETGEALASASVGNDSETTSLEDKTRGRSEWDAERAFDRAAECIRQVVASRPGLAIRALGVTGQMHGMLLAAKKGADPFFRAVSPFIGWQDARCDETVPGEGQTWIERMMEVAGPDAFVRAGCQPATGYLGATLYWLRENSVEGRASKREGRRHRLPPPFCG